MKLSANAAHVIAVILVGFGQTLQFFNTNPAIAVQLHVTAMMMTGAGFVVALVSQSIWGTPTPPAPAPLAAANTNTRGFAAMHALIALVVALPLTILGGKASSATGCSAQQGQTVAQLLGPGLIFAGCVWSTYQKEPAGTSLVTVVGDEIAACGGDGATVITVLDQHEPPAMHARMAHENATTTTVSRP
jgi:hypothetical protein